MKMTIQQQSDIVGVIDVSPTFMPGGELAVPDGDAVIPVVNRLLGVFDDAFATEDWHPRGHQSFASSHPGRQAYDMIAMPYGEQVLWPDHGIQNSENAKTHPAVDQSKVQIIIRKGFRKHIDSYSGFYENDRATSTGLDAWLKARGKKRLFPAGLATDFCVAYTAEDGVKLGYEVFVVEDACRGIGIPTGEGRNSIDLARDRLNDLGVHFVSSAQLLD